MAGIVTGIDCVVNQLSVRKRAKRLADATKGTPEE
jgi:hypothetical protein